MRTPRLSSSSSVIADAIAEMFDVETDIGAFALKTTGVFQNEAKMSDIQIELEVSSAFKSLGLQTIMTDPVRLSQMCV